MPLPGEHEMLSRCMHLASWRLTFPFREPKVVRQVVRHLMVQAVDQVQHILGEEDGVIIPIQDPLVIIQPHRLIRPERRQSRPAPGRTGTQLLPQEQP